jgi:MFS superfamily sulfate permease-like transporter
MFDLLFCCTHADACLLMDVATLFVQVKFILGYNIPRVDTLHETIAVLVEKRAGFRWQECVMGLSMLLFLIVLRLVGKKVKKLHWIGALGPILACIISIIAVVAGQLENKGIKIVKNIPRGMASPSSGLLLPTVILAQHTACR